MNPTLLLAWLDEHPRARAAVYDVVLGVSLVLGALCWGLPLVDVDHLGRIDLDELGKIAIATGAAAAALARRNVPPATYPDDGE